MHQGLILGIHRRGAGPASQVGGAANCPPGNSSLVCIRTWMSTHPTDHEPQLRRQGPCAAARSGERGALRSLAVNLDERLGHDDACLDGAVMAWRAVDGGHRRSDARMAAVARRLISFRRRLITGRGVPSSGLHGDPAKRANLGPAMIAAPRPDSLTDADAPIVSPSEGGVAGRHIRPGRHNMPAVSHALRWPARCYRSPAAIPTGVIVVT